MDKAKIEDFCSAPTELFQVHSLHLISTGMLYRTSGAFTAPHLLRNALPDFRCIHCTSSLPECSARLQVTSCHLISPEYSAGLQVHSLHLISSGMLCQTSGAFTAPHLYQNALPDFRCIHCTSSLPGNSISFRCNECPEVKKCCYATKHYQCRMSYLYGFNYIL